MILLYDQETIRQVQVAARKLNYSSLATFRQEAENSLKLLAAIFTSTWILLAVSAISLNAENSLNLLSRR